jgi:hypothetical protein
MDCEFHELLGRDGLLDRGLVEDPQPFHLGAVDGPRLDKLREEFGEEARGRMPRVVPSSLVGSVHRRWAECRAVSIRWTQCRSYKSSFTIKRLPSLCFPS